MSWYQYAIFVFIILLSPIKELIAQIVSVDSQNPDQKIEVTLMISLNDGLAFSQAEIDIIETYLNHTDSNHPVISVVQSSSRLGLFDSSTRLALIKKLSKIDFSKYVISKLVLNTHGGSYTLEDESDSKTELGYIGEFGEEGPDQNFRSVFDPLLDYFSDDLVIVLNSCSTLCGTPEHRGRRIKSLFDYFKTKKGQIYGAYVTESGSYLFYSPYLKIKNFLPSLKMFSFMFFSSPAFLGPGLQLFLDEITVSSLVIGGVIFGLIPNFVRATATRLNGADNGRNWGFIYRYDGEDLEYKKINKTVSRFSTIYQNNMCGFYLL